MTSGPRALVLLVGGTLIVFLGMLLSLWPSLRPYRRSAGRPASSAPAPPAPPGDTVQRALPRLVEPRGGKKPEGRPGTLDSGRDPESPGRVILEPAPFQPSQPAAAPPEAVPPPIAPAQAPPQAESPPGAAPSADPPDAGGTAASGREAATREIAQAPVLEPPVVLKAAWLSYPESARQNRAEGNVEVRIRVSESGGVLEVALARSAGDTALDQAALAAARTLRFRAARLGGTPVAVWYNYRFVFTAPR